MARFDSSDIVKGYEVEPDTYITLEPEEIDAVKLESKKTIDLVQFIDAKEIDYRYFERPYFITPADKLAAEGYVVIRDALRKTNKVGLAQVTIAGREWLVAIAALEDGLIMEMLRYAEELRKSEDFFHEVPPEKPAKEMVDLAVQLITQKSGPFDPRSSRITTRRHSRNSFRRSSRATRSLPRPSSPASRVGNVVDLMAALRASIEGKKPPTKAKVSKGRSKSA